MPIERPCVLCGSEKRELVHRARTHGLDVRTVLCLDCGLVYAHPMFTEEEKLSALSAGPSALHTPGARAGAVERHNQKRVGRYLGALEAELGCAQTLLDIGCGDGALLREATRRGLQAVGIEDSPQNAETARQVSGAEVIQGCYEPVDLGQRRFDLVTGTHVLEHVIDPLDLLTWARGLLAEEGRLFVEVPNVMRPVTSLRRTFTLPHNYHFSPETLAALLLRAGLRPLRRRVYTRGVVSVLAVRGEEPTTGASNPAHAAEVRETLQRYRRTYYVSFRFAWRKLPAVRQREYHSFEEHQF